MSVSFGFDSIRPIFLRIRVDSGTLATVSLSRDVSRRDVLVGGIDMGLRPRQAVSIEMANGALLLDFAAESGELSYIEAQCLVTPHQARDVFDLANEYHYPLVVSALASLMTLWDRELVNFGRSSRGLWGEFLAVAPDPVDE